MLNTAQCAEILEVHKQTVIYYLQNNYLKGILVDGAYQVALKDLEVFEEEYPQLRTKHLRFSKNFTISEFDTLSDFIEAVKDGMSIDELVERYEKTEIKIPSQTIYTRFRRNQEIKRLKAEGYTIAFLAEKFKLHNKTIEKIVYTKETV